MKKKLKQYVQRFESFSLRERLMVMLAMLAAMYVLFDFYLLKPVQMTQSTMLESINKWKSKIADQNKQVQAISTAYHETRNDGIDDQVVTLKEKINENNQRMEGLVFSFITPRQMAEVLKNLLQQEQGLKLMRLQSQQVQPLFVYEPLLPAEIDGDGRFTPIKDLLQSYRHQIIQEKRQTGLDVNDGTKQKPFGNSRYSTITGSAGIFRHGIEIEFYGDFKSTLSYLQAVEALPWRFYWDEVNYSVEEYPRALVKVTLYTLSLDRGWLGV
ncbi:MAG: hypothetical protein GXP08_12740 [Gammaproteobacteria bacterium]|nr:hypothetical protein [Gammaproteobacteria bacterium]